MPDFPLQPRDAEGPVFKEPWQAQAFGLVLALHQQGHFSWEEWATALSEEIKTAQQAGDPDLGDTYYQHWLVALEKITIAKGITRAEEMRERKAEWHDAYIHTPHGKPVELG